jgi:hypothetical protein
MPTLLGNYLANAVLATYFQNGPVWLALHLSDPTPTGDANTEFSGGNYSRQRIYFGAPGSKSITNNSSVIFPNLAPATIPYFGFWTSKAATNTGFLSSYQLVPPLAVIASSQVLVQIGDISIALV